MVESYFVVWTVLTFVATPAVVAFVVAKNTLVAILVLVAVRTGVLLAVDLFH